MAAQEVELADGWYMLPSSAEDGRHNGHETDRREIVYFGVRNKRILDCCYGLHEDIADRPFPQKTAFTFGVGNNPSVILKYEQVWGRTIYSIVNQFLPIEDEWKDELIIEI